MDSYGHYAVDNGMPPYVDVDMLAGTVVEFDSTTGNLKPRSSGNPVGVLAYDVKAGCTATVATDGVVIIRVMGSAAIGDWLRAGADGTASVAGTGPALGQCVTPIVSRGTGIWSAVTIHLNILPEAEEAEGP